MEGLTLLGIVAQAHCIRSIDVFLCLIKTRYTKKERLFIILSYLPKATVQASIGSIALMEGFACGALVLTAAVVSILFTAPFGAILIDSTHSKLLTKEHFEAALEK